ncbi:unnamed protein product [Ostreobium quekettii]|uniref:Phosphate transporter n=1 Tax=Ostreobium quekettii TaxID=121088 RepID=A0A8S1J4S5_9CHLO|nr:unnamed protein product [Ostreobium quekettii]|eukprot:evm.model.scf_2273.5 EVM.evm.TU.scf_2273.5   scf_2273:19945-22240(-)
MTDNWDQYEWIVVMGAMLAFFTAYGIGANDVANAFATSVGARSITLGQAVVIAGVFEFAGAVLLGSSVTDTVRKGVAETKPFEDDPEVLMYGMMCVIAATGLWLLLASYLELPVSTTHSAIGGIIGMALTAKGSEAVVWYEFDDSKEALKKYKGVAPIIVSWVVSPVFSGFLAMGLFLFVRRFILQHEDSRQRSFIFFPFLVGVTIALNVYFIIYKGFKRKLGKDKKALSDILGAGWSTLIALGLGTIIGVSIWFFFIPWLKEKVEQNLREQDSRAAAASARSLGPEKPQKRNGDSGRNADSRRNGDSGRNADSRRNGDTGRNGDPANRDRSAAGRLAGAVNRITDRDVHGVIKTDKQVADIYESSKSYDAGTEESFKYLQVFTATMDSFAHGANDVANAMGPFAAIWDIYKNRGFSGSKSDVPEWILVIGGAGITVGLATYGYNIIRAIGVKLVKMSASRGFAIELGAATVIVVGSRYGIPLSTTHCQVGATVGVGLMEGKKGVNLQLLLKVIVGWVITLVAVGGVTAAFFAQGVYAPSIPNLDAINRYTSGMNGTLSDMTDLLSDLGQSETATNLQSSYEETLETAADGSMLQAEIFDSAFAAVDEQCRTLLS